MATKKKHEETAVVEPVEEIIDGIKGFGLDWKCREFQFELGATYQHDGPVKACNSGFHAISGYPLEVFDYYPPGVSRYAEVKQSGTLARHADDSKVASATITIGVEVHLHDLIQRAVKWVFDRATPEGKGSHATGDSGAASATGVRGAASATGDSGAASATGVRGAAMAAGRDGRAMGAMGCALFLVYRDADWNIKHAWAGIAGQNGIKPLTWYTLNAKGEPEPVEAV